MGILSAFLREASKLTSGDFGLIFILAFFTTIIVIYSVFLHQYSCIHLQFVGIYGWALTFLEREERRHLATNEKGGEYATVESSRLIKVILDDDLDFRLRSACSRPPQ